ncbi:MAG: OmpA family protein [Gammaproteobacteria bacterium]
MYNKLTIMTLLIFILSACSTPFVNPAHPGSTLPYNRGPFADPEINNNFHSWWGTGKYHWGGEKTYKQLQRLAEEGVQVIQLGQNLRIIIPTDKLFQFSYTNAVIYPSSSPILNRVVAFLKRFGNVPLMITGYSDSVYERSASRALTLKQAQSVAEYLWTHGIEYDKIETRGADGTDFVATNGNSFGSFYNRRIEITLLVIPLEHRCSQPNCY